MAPTGQQLGLSATALLWPFEAKLFSLGRHGSAGGAGVIAGCGRTATHPEPALELRISGAVAGIEHRLRAPRDPPQFLHQGDERGLTRRFTTRHGEHPADDPGSST